MEPNLRQTQPTQTYDCVTCHLPFGKLHTADSHAPFLPRVNDILYCSTCGTVNKVNAESKLELVTEEEIATWDDQERADLRRARSRVSAAWKTKLEKN